MASHSFVHSRIEDKVGKKIRQDSEECSIFDKGRIAR